MNDDLLEEIVLPRPLVDLDALEKRGRIVLTSAEWIESPSGAVMVEGRELDALIAELRTLRAQARPSSNGHQVAQKRSGRYPHVCAGCGDEFTSNRRAVPGKHSWCGKPGCKKQAAALRSEEYRQRKAEQR